MSRVGQPSRARDVLRHIDLIEGTGDPPSWLIERVRSVRAARFGQLTYDDYAGFVWHEGGPGDLLRKAIASVELEALRSAT